MPLKRTPPPQKSVSDSNLDDVGLSDKVVMEKDSQNINTVRLKRKREMEGSGFMDEVRSLFKNFTEQQNNKLESLQSTIKEIKTQNSEITATIQLLSDKYDDFRKELDLLKHERKEQLTYIKILENRLDYLEKNTCAAKIEIRNIPKIPNESKQELTKVVQSIGDLINTPILTSDIKDLHRGFAKPHSPKPIVVEFISVLKKENILKIIKDYNKSEREKKLNTSLLKLDGPSVPIFISESLTFKTKRLFFLARNFAKTHGYTFCWSSYGKIYLRKKEGSPQIRIDEEVDLAKLKESNI